MRGWAESLIVAVLIVGMVLWFVRVFIEAVYGVCGWCIYEHIRESNAVVENFLILCIN